jgi:hypothetical protein
MLHLPRICDHRGMTQASGPPIFVQAFACWNWKCALLSAAARSIVYLAAMAHSGLRGGLAIVAVEMAYVTLTAGVYAGMQQRALELRSRLLGNSIVVVAVPMLAQIFDWLTHRAAGAAAPARATFAVCVFATVSALFHLYVMRKGAFLTGRCGRPLLDDFRRMPGLTSGFALMPIALLASIAGKLVRGMASEPAV